MKIVVLDGYCLNPGDLDWAELDKLGDVTMYDRTPSDMLLERAAGAEVLLTNKTIISAEAIDSLPSLKYVGVLATGYNVVDVKHASERGVVVTNIPAYSTSSVAQMAIAHLLNISLRVAHYAHENQNLKWSQSADFSYTDTRLIELAGKTMGIVGLGNTGMATARIALAMGMRVVALTSKTCLPDGITSVSKNVLFASSDVISLHCPLTPDTKHIVCDATLALMKPDAILINTGRGPLIDEDALVRALNEGRIYAAGLDVLSQEPPRSDNPLLSARNCFITPHIAWATFEARQRLMHIAVSNIAAWQSGAPQNVVS